MKVIILGATSAVAEAAARLYAAEGASLVLAARDGARLEAIAADLRVRGAREVHVAPLDLAKVDGAAVKTRFEAWTTRLDGLDHVLLAYGVLGDQAHMETDLDAAAALIDADFRSAALWCLEAAGRLEVQRRGALVVLGSVAGDRGRQSNYIYGAAKAGLSVLVQGIAHRLAPTGARAVVVKPGFIDTPMTAHLKKGGPLWSRPAAVARIVRAAADGRAPVVYAPGFWRWVLAAIRLTPAAVFHKTKL